MLFKQRLFSTRFLADGVSKDSLLILPLFSPRADYYLWVVAVFCCGVLSLEYGHMFCQSHHRWSHSENEEILLCYYKANPNVRGYRRRMFDTWKERHPDDGLTEQRVADQALFLLRNKKFTDLELDSIQQSAQCSVSEPPVQSPAVTFVEVDGDLPELQNNIDGELPIDSKCCVPDVSILSSKQLLLKDKIELVLHSDAQRIRLPKLKYCKKLCECMKDVNQVVKCITTSDIFETVKLMYAVAYTVTEHMGYSVEQCTFSLGDSPPAWDKRLNNKFQRLRGDLSHLEELKAG